MTMFKLRESVHIKKDDCSSGFADIKHVKGRINSPCLKTEKVSEITYLPAEEQYCRKE